VERNYDEVIADMLIQLDGIERRMEKADHRMMRADKRNDLIIRRLVKAETRMERHDNRMELFDQKLERSIEDQRNFSAMQSELNQYFLNFIRNSNGKK
jgi:hypothetical protein